MNDRKTKDMKMKKKLVTMFVSIGLIGAMCTQTIGCAANKNNYIINFNNFLQN